MSKVVVVGVVGRLGIKENNADGAPFSKIKCFNAPAITIENRVQ